MQEQRRHQIVWRNVVIMGVLHVLGVFSLTQLSKARFLTLICGLVYFYMGSIGVTAGAHRLWSHRSYKAKLPLRIILAIFNCIAFENSILEWARDHRVHHKHSETDADPHNAKRGFFFSHVGWLFMRKHPDVIKKGKELDLSDLKHDPVVIIQDKYYRIFAVVFALVLPTVIPAFWGEKIWISFLVCSLRMCAIYNGTWLVNSAAHQWGNKPYDKYINPSENRFVSVFAMGEGFHNYHHVFPHDYRTSEHGIKFNLTTAFINLMTYVGLAYDCRKVETKTILARRKRTGNLQEVDDSAK